MAWTSISVGNGVFVISEETVGDVKTLNLDNSIEAGLVTAGLRGKVFEIVNIRMEYTATATVTNRTVSIELQDPADSDVLSLTEMQTAVAPSATELFNWAPRSLSQVASAAQDIERIPVLYIGPGIKTVIGAVTSIDAADTCIVHIMLRQIE